MADFRVLSRSCGRQRKNEGSSQERDPGDLGEVGHDLNTFMLWILAVCGTCELHVSRRTLACGAWRLIWMRHGSRINSVPETNKKRSPQDAKQSERPFHRSPSRTFVPLVVQSFAFSVPLCLCGEKVQGAQQGRSIRAWLRDRSYPSKFPSTNRVPLPLSPDVESSLLRNRESSTS